MSYAQAILALVKRWHTLEPDRCGPWKGEPHDVYPTAYFLERRHPRSTGRICFTEEGAMQLGGDEELLFAVLDAIEARGGEWMVRAGPNLWVAGVSLTAGEDAYWDGQGDSRASATHALLAAYVAALEAEAGQ